ncbi:LysR family transcriptional regulator [Nocardiopsis flavescens]|uniref:LysR family transcriptional regulator n=1 Tax=Nocardiopsis flavescens TaxID=758803 RepID=UPI001FEC0C28|nr:LysR family transcriptional regulator [Nocardiopsis flavescens]
MHQNHQSHQKPVRESPVFDPDSLKSFLSVIDTGSFVAAADRLRLTQPRVSQQVAALERELGVVLFDRSKRPIRATDAGRALSGQARRVLEVMADARTSMDPWRTRAQGVVHLGSYPSVSAAFIPALLRRQAEREPDVKVVLTEHSTLELDAANRRGEVDLYLRPLHPEPPEHVGSLPLWREPLVIVHALDHPLSRIPDPVPLTEVAAHPIISIGRLEDADSADFEAYRVFRERGLNLVPVQATDQPQTLVSLAASGLGVGVTNWLATRTADTSDVRVRVLEEGLERRVALCWDSSRPFTPAVRSVHTAISEADIPEGTSTLSTLNHERDLSSHTL